MSEHIKQILKKCKKSGIESFAMVMKIEQKDNGRLFTAFNPFRKNIIFVSEYYCHTEFKDILNTIAIGDVIEYVEAPNTKTAIQFYEPIRNYSYEQRLKSLNCMYNKVFCHDR